MFRQLRLFPLMCLLFFSWPLNLCAQGVITGQITGIVNDPTSAGVSQTNVLAVNKDTAFRRQIVSDDSGEFAVTSLPPGRYALTFTKNGFKAAQIEQLTLTVAETIRLAITLQVGEVKDEVNVSSTVSQMQTQPSDLSLLVNGRNIRDLPLNGRNFQQLIQLAPGVGAGNNPSVNGARSSTNTYLVDGVLSSEERIGSGFALNGGASGFYSNAPNVISTEALEEFRAITSNADASYGRTSGGQINIVTKSGTNSFHGSAYDYLRNDKLDARYFFNDCPFLDRNGRAQTPPFKQNLFGGSISGPIRRDKDFFFGNYEGFRQRLQAQTGTTALLPNAALISLIPGDLGQLYRTYYVDRGIVPSSGNPAGVFSPLPASDASTAIAAGFNPATVLQAGTVVSNITPTRNIDQDSFLIHTDHYLTEKLTGSFRYAFARPTQLTNNSDLPLDLNINKRSYQSGVAQFTFAKSPAQLLS